MPATLVVAALLLVTVVKRCRSCLLPTLIGENCLLDPCLLLNPCGPNSECSAVFDLQGNVLADLTQCICLSETLQGDRCTECVPGKTGTNCASDINECASAPCKNGGACNNEANRYSCSCSLPYSGARCEIYNPYLFAINALSLGVV